jgi:hypothetical protein
MALTQQYIERHVKKMGVSASKAEEILASLVLRYYFRVSSGGEPCA